MNFRKAYKFTKFVNEGELLPFRTRQLAIATLADTTGNQSVPPAPLLSCVLCSYSWVSKMLLSSSPVGITMDAPEMQQVSSLPDARLKLSRCLVLGYGSHNQDSGHFSQGQPEGEHTREPGFSALPQGHPSTEHAPQGLVVMTGETAWNSK